MSRPPSKVDGRLEARLRRIGDALEQNRSHYGAMARQIAAARGADAAQRVAAAAERIEASTEEATDRLAGRAAQVEARFADKAERFRSRDERRRRRESGGDGSDLPRGIVFAIAATVCLLFAIRQPAMFWMVFVALGLGMSAASSFGRALRGRRQAREAKPEAAREPVDTSPPVAVPTAAPQPPPVSAPPPRAEADPPDPKVLRIQSLCDKLIAELESGPPIVREVVTEPHATIDGLRQACVETARRERELRNVLAAQDDAALVAERDALSARVSAETDAIVRDRLGQAMRALEQQLANRAELATAATRLEAENTRILYTLENLHMQLLRARSTDVGAPELGGRLRESLRALGTQIDAVAEALEWASSPADAPRAPDAVAGQDETPRAERLDAARRSRARETQRH